MKNFRAYGTICLSYDSALSELTSDPVKLVNIQCVTVHSQKKIAKMACFDKAMQLSIRHL